MSPVGSDLNTGTSPASPVNSLQLAAAIAAAHSCHNIYVQAGVYGRGSGLNSSDSGVILSNFITLNFMGGWNSGFTAQTGQSELDGAGALLHIITVSNITGLTMNGFVIRGGSASGSSGTPGCIGGGMLLAGLTNSVIYTCILSNNSGLYDGALSMQSCRNCSITNCLFTYNTTTFQYASGVVCISTGSSKNTLDSAVEYNMGGGINICGSTNNTILGVSRYNETNSYGSGPGICVGTLCYGNTIAAPVYNNQGSGISFWEGESNIIQTSVYNNGGDGIDITCGKSNYIAPSTLVYNNTGNGISVDNYGYDAADGYYLTKGNVVSAQVYNNGSCGVQVTGGTGALISGALIYGNTGIGVILVGGLGTKMINSTILGDASAKTSSSELFINSGTTNTMITNNFITNINIPSGYGIIMLSMSSANNLSIYANTLIAASGKSVTGLLEANSDCTGYILANNSFGTNNLANLMWDFYNGPTSDINQVNNPAYSGSAQAYGNIGINQ